MLLSSTGWEGIVREQDGADDQRSIFSRQTVSLGTRFGALPILALSNLLQGLSMITFYYEI